MPFYRKKRTYRRRPITRRRRFIRRIRRPRIPRSLNINKSVCRYAREIPISTNLTIPSGSTFATYGYYFDLTGWLPNSTEFTVLFDQYRLRSVIFKMRLVSPPEANNTPVTLQYYPDVVISVDHDDATAPTTVDELRQFGKSKCGILKPNSWFKYKCYPTTSIQMYTTPTTSGYAPARNKQWIDLAYPNVRYYGLKIALDCTSLGTLANTLVVEARAYMVWEFKNSR